MEDVKEVLSIEKEGRRIGKVEGRQEIIKDLREWADLVLSVAPLWHDPVINKLDALLEETKEHHMRYTYYGTVPLAATLSVVFSAAQELTAAEQLERLAEVASQGVARVSIDQAPIVPYDGSVTLSDQHEVQIAQRLVEGNVSNLITTHAEIDDDLTERSDD